MKIINSRALSVLLISFSLLYNSCSVIGFGVGALVDSGKPDNRDVGLRELEIDEEIIIILKDYSIHKGKLISVTEDNLTLKLSYRIEHINVADIIRIEIKSKKSGKWTGFKIGLKIDLTILPLLLLLIAYGDGT